MAALTLFGDVDKTLETMEYVCLNDSWFLPRDSKIIKTCGHGASLWTQGGKIDVQLADGSKQSYFIKITETPIGRAMSLGEYESTVWMHKLVPGRVPKPMGWGTFDGAPDTHFYLAEFIDIHDEVYPSVEELVKFVAEYQLRSQPLSPKGQFGFHVPTCGAMFVQKLDWNDSWEAFFSAYFADCIEQERGRAGQSDEIDQLAQEIIQKVIPRLLRPLETGGNTILPTIIHGDLWFGNTATDKTTGEIRMFDFGSFWAHNEWDLHNWAGTRYPRFKFNDEHINAYFAHIPPSEPRSEWRDRHNLYFAACSLMFSYHWPKGVYRAEAIREMRALVNKFPEGYTGPYKRKGSDTTLDVTDTRVDEPQQK